MFPSASKDQGVGPTGAAPLISEQLNEDVAFTAPSGSGSFASLRPI